LSYKKYSYISIFILLALFIFNAIVWNFYTKQWFTPSSYHIGDLSRLGYLHDYEYPRKTYVDLPRIHKETNNITIDDKIDIMVIGDSFAGGVSGGKNPSFVDYISAIYKTNTLRLDDYPGTNDPIENIALLANSGFLDKLHPKTIIIESTERQLTRRFARDSNFDKNDSLTNIVKNYGMLNGAAIINKELNQTKPTNNTEETAPQKMSNIGFINNGNFKFILNKIIYLFSDTSPLTNVVIKDLNQSLFTIKNDKKLLNFKRDIFMPAEQDMKNLKKINENFSRLSSILSNKGINLVFMPVASKYTIYMPYIIDNNLPIDKFFEQFEKLPKSYGFINTKKILSNAMPIKDLYYVDDTHWSYKASDIIISSKEFEQIINTVRK